MFEFLAVASRYVFVAYMVVFLWSGALYVVREREHGKKDEGRLASIITLQRSVVALFHVHAYLLLSYSAEFVFDAGVITLGIMGLVFMMAAHVAVERIYKGSCRLMWNCVIFLLIIGIVILQRLSSHYPALVGLQLTWFYLGFGATLLIPLVLRIISRSENLGIIYLVASGLLLLLPLLFGEELHGAYRWVEIGGISFQPSALVKFLLVFYLASFLRRKRSFAQLILPAVAVAGMVLMLVMSVDLGSALIFFMTFMVMVYISTGSVLILGSGFGAAVAASMLAYNMFAHLRRRVVAWQDPFGHIDNEGFQLAHSLFAIGSYGLFGAGLTMGIPHVVPVVASDFIFVAISEEFGSAFGVGLIGVFVIIFYRGCHVALRCTKPYYALLAAGFTSLLAFQTFLILGGVTTLIPLTGITLPFISYGGSSAVVSIMMIGVIQWVHIYNHEVQSS